MHIEVADYNNAAQVIANSYGCQWAEIEGVLRKMPLYLKASDQAGIQGRAIFDPVGTNQHIANGLVSLGWKQKIPIPEAFKFLGTDVDFGRRGVVLEVQFSNYPFLLNNTQRSDLFFRAKTVFHEAPTGLVIIVTKSGMFPSSNSTLYYELAVNQLTALSQHAAFSVPIRLVGLFESVGRVQATWTEYSTARYSRTVSTRSQRSFDIANGQASKCTIEPV